MEPVHMQMVQKDGEAITYVPARRKSKFDLIPARYIMAVLSSIGLAIIYGLKVNLSVAIVAMINHTALAQSHADDLARHLNLSNGHLEPKGEECSTGNSTEVVVDGPFVWSEPIQGLVLGSYFWGYLITQFPGGRISELFSAKWVMWGAVVVNVIFTLLTPVAANLSYIAVLVVRVFEGFGGGVTLPAMHVMIARWTPPQERSRMSAIVYAGTALGTVISMTLAGVLAGQLGWEAVFYVMGGLASIWCILWIVFVYDSPELHPRISEEERTYIATSLGGGAGGHDHKKAMPVPWKAVFTSLPFYAIMVAHTLGNFGWYMLLIELPTYMNHVLKFNIQENSGLSSVPFLCMWLFSIVASNRLDWASSNKYITTTVARKLATATASIIPGICLVAVSFVGCDRVLAVTFMTIAVMCIGAMFSGYLSNHIDIAPNYAGTLMALTNTVATIPGFVVPVFVGELTHGNQTVGQWQIIFCTTAALFGLEAIFYTIFGSGQEQPWNKVQEKGTEEENTKM